MRPLQTSSLSNQNIYNAAAGLLAATYTADEDKEIYIQLFADQVAGNGTYTAWITKQRGGACSFFEISPRTQAVVPTGVTAIGFPSVALPVRSGDIVRVYL